MSFLVRSGRAVTHTRGVLGDLLGAVRVGVHLELGVGQHVGLVVVADLEQLDLRCDKGVGDGCVAAGNRGLCRRREGGPLGIWIRGDRLDHQGAVFIQHHSDLQGFGFAAFHAVHDGAGTFLRDRVGVGTRLHKADIGEIVGAISASACLAEVDGVVDRHR